MSWTRPSVRPREPVPEMDLRKCARCGLRVSAGACDTPPLVYHTQPEHCIEALRAELAYGRGAKVCVPRKSQDRSRSYAPCAARTLRRIRTDHPVRTSRE